jgi:predicted DNA binding CopG/RHH family protein
VEFEWDLSKEIENLQKHGIAFAEAVETFSDPNGFQLTDMEPQQSRRGSSGWANQHPAKSSRRASLGATINSGSSDRHRGENSRGFTMKEPRLNELVIDDKGTQQIRRKMAAARSVKITMNIDKGSLDILRAKAAETGVPYQRLLNQFLNRALQNDAQTESRLDRLEKEVARLKKVVA